MMLRRFVYHRAVALGCLCLAAMMLFCKAVLAAGNDPANPPAVQTAAPHGMTAKTFAACLLLSAKTHNVPAAVLIGIMRVEGGHIGEESDPNPAGNRKLGPMQISSSLVPELAKDWNVPESTAYEMVRDDGCINVDVAAWLLRKHLDEAGYLIGAIEQYHSADKAEGQKYAKGCCRGNATLRVNQGKRVCRSGQARNYQC